MTVNHVLQIVSASGTGWNFEASYFHTQFPFHTKPVAQSLCFTGNMSCVGILLTCSFWFNRTVEGLRLHFSQTPSEHASLRNTFWAARPWSCSLLCPMCGSFSVTGMHATLKAETGTHNCAPLPASSMMLYADIGAHDTGAMISFKLQK